MDTSHMTFEERAIFEAWWRIARLCLVDLARWDLPLPQAEMEKER